MPIKFFLFFFWSQLYLSIASFYLVCFWTKLIFSIIPFFSLFALYLHDLCYSFMISLVTKICNSDLLQSESENRSVAPKFCEPIVSSVEFARPEKWSG